MAQLATSFDPRTVEPQKAFEPLSRGDYDVMVVNTSVERTKADNGSMLVVELEVQSGPHTHRKVFDRIMLENPNVQAVEIGQRQLSGLCHATGWLQPLTDSDVLHGRMCVARIGIETDKSGKYQDKNKVVAYTAHGVKQAAAQGAPVLVTQAASSQPAAKKKPWEK